MRRFSRSYSYSYSVSGAWSTRMAEYEYEYRFAEYELEHRSRRPHLPALVVGEHVAFEEIDDGIWTNYFFHSPVGRYHECKSRITPMPSPR